MRQRPRTPAPATVPTAALVRARPRTRRYRRRVRGRLRRHRHPHRPPRARPHPPGHAMTHADTDDLSSSVPHFLPLLGERFASQRLTALAKVEGKRDDGRPIVLFLCVHNAGRSQMALGFFQHLAADAAVAWSGGSEPGDEVNPAAIAAMGERGIDISAEYPKPWTDEIARAADVVVSMGCGDACPVFPGRRSEDSVLDEP